MRRSVLLLIGIAAMLIIHSGTSMAQSAAQLSTAAKAEQTTSEVPQVDVVVAAGTRILTTLVSPLHTVSASEGSGVYLETFADVIVGNRVAIPAGTKVQGTVEQDSRPGRAKGRAHLQFHLSSMILPNNFVIPISGGVTSLPGSSTYEKKRNAVFQPVDQIDKDARTVLATTLTGAALGGMSYGHVGAGWGSLIGAGFGVGQSLFTRGDDIRMNAGTRVEIMLDSPISLPASKLMFPLPRPAATGIQPVEPRETAERTVPRNRSRSMLPLVLPRF